MRCKKENTVTNKQDAVPCLSGEEVAKIIRAAGLIREPHPTDHNTIIIFWNPCKDTPLLASFIRILSNKSTEFVGSITADVRGVSWTFSLHDTKYTEQVLQLHQRLRDNFTTRYGVSIDIRAMMAAPSAISGYLVELTDRIITKNYYDLYLRVTEYKPGAFVEFMVNDLLHVNRDVRKMSLGMLEVIMLSCELGDISVPEKALSAHIRENCTPEKALRKKAALYLAYLIECRLDPHAAREHGIPAYVSLDKIR
jgi:hypothetical protein